MAAEIDGWKVTGVRPFYTKRLDPTGETVETTVLYPLFHWRSYGDSYAWSVLSLVNRYGRKDGAPATPHTESQSFDAWPFYFSRDTGEPANSYHALFPIVGTMKDRLGYSELSWTLFPLYVRSEKNGAITTSTPWPIFRVTQGAKKGFALWPLFGWSNGPENLSSQFFIWPLIWNNRVAPDVRGPEDAPPTHEVGFLPFFTSEHGAGLDSVNYLWPFFGATHRTIPYTYDETRYFWPFLVQGRGQDHFVNRTGPFYTHSVIKGMDKTWILWPLWRQARWTDDGLAQTKSQFFYFLYWKLEQRSPTNPTLASAEKVHFWPFVGIWDNGAGHRQVQLLDPFEVFFPNNQDVREAWTPLFSLYRYDKNPAGEVRRSLMWNAITWTSSARQDLTEFHLGPLLSVDRTPSAGRIAIGKGAFGLKRSGSGNGWRPFWMEFSPKPDTLISAR